MTFVVFVIVCVVCAVVVISSLSAIVVCTLLFNGIGSLYTLVVPMVPLGTICIVAIVISVYCIVCNCEYRRAHGVHATPSGDNAGLDEENNGLTLCQAIETVFNSHPHPNDDHIHVDCCAICLEDHYNSVRVHVLPCGSQDTTVDMHLDFPSLSQCRSCRKVFHSSCICQLIVIGRLHNSEDDYDAVTTARVSTMCPCCKQSYF